MEVKEFIGKVHIAYKGKGAHKAPVKDTDKYKLYLSVANDMLRNWSEDPKYNWDSLYEFYEDTFTGNSIEAPTGFCKLIEPAELENGNLKLELKPTKVRSRKRDKNAYYVYGNSPRTIDFTFGETLTDYVGGSLSFAFGTYAPKLVNETDPVICDSLQWLIYATAAELARNDPAKDDQFEPLLQLASVEYTKMTDTAKVVIMGQENSIQRKSTAFNIGGGMR